MKWVIQKILKKSVFFQGFNYAMPMKVTIRLVVWNIDPITKTKDIRAVKEQDVYFGEIPLMTERGTFIINGTERAIVSQLHRSPGVYFDADQAKSPTSGTPAYTARLFLTEVHGLISSLTTRSSYMFG